MAIVGILFVLILLGAAFLANHLKKMKADFDRLGSEEYDAVFFSMYPTDYYVEEDYLYFRNMHIVKTSYQIPNGKIMRRYMDAANQSGNTIHTVYLGIDPLRTAKEDIVIMAQENPDIRFEIVPAYPQIEYWMELSEAQFEKAVQNYKTFAEWVTVLPNASVYFFSGEEWLICNSGNYRGTFLTNAEVSQFLMCNTDGLHPYQLTAETVESAVQKMQELIAGYRTLPPAYADAADLDIVFLGDSIIGNYTDSMSVPSVVGALTGARVYNCGYGGTSAAFSSKTNLPLPAVAEKIIKADNTGIPVKEQIYAGITEFINRKNQDRQLLFVINYGLNDYFDGIPVETSDDYDIGSYSGAIRMAVKALKNTYPEASVLLMTPNVTIYYENGTERKSEQGGILKEYADAVLCLAEELKVDVLDNFHELPITEQNWKEYQDDGCHLNERGRFLMGSRIANKIKAEKD